MLPGLTPNDGEMSVLNIGSYTPKLTDATTKIMPSKLNHAVHQPKPLPPKIEPQWYKPPAVG